MRRGFGLTGFGFGTSGPNNSGSPAWSPFSLGDALLGYWDAEVLGSLTLSGGNVSAWASLVGGYAPTQGTANSRPVYSTTSFNGRPGVTFDGTDDYLELASVPAAFPVGSAGGEIWVLCDNTALGSDTGARGAFAYGNTERARFVGRVGVSNVNRGRINTGNGTNGIGVSDTAADAAGKRVLRYIVTASTQSISVDGGTATSGSVTANTATARTRIGANANSSIGNYWLGAIAVIPVTNPLTGDQAVALSAYLKARGGIA